MKNRIVLIMLLFPVLIFPVKAQTDVPGGDVDTTWAASGSPYRIQGDITVQYGDTLRIEPGVKVDFEGYYSLTVRGILLAEGEEGDSIYLTRLDSGMNPDTTGLADTSSTNGSWAGIVFDMMSDTDSSILQYCVVEYISSVNNYETNHYNLKASIHISHNDIVRIRHSVMRNNLSTLATLFCQGLLRIEDCLFRYNKAFGSPHFSCWPSAGIKIYNEDNCQILKNTFLDNRVYASGGSGAILVSNSRALILNNFISNNRSYRVHAVTAGGILLTHAYPVIANNLIVNNQCDNASAIYYQWSGGKLLNNTICNNKSDGSGYGAIVIEGPTGMIGNNNLLYNNKSGTISSQIHLSNMNSMPEFTRNLIGEGIDEVTGEDNGAIREEENYFGNPQLNNPTTTVGIGEYSTIGDWQLTTGTSLINQGDKTFIREYDIQADILGYKRINYGDVDIGCAEYRLNAITPGASINAPVTWIADTVYINQELTINDKLTVYPGVVICFTDTCGWRVYDSLYVLGNEDAPVLFTRDDTSGFYDQNSSDGGWGFIQLAQHAPKIFRHCIFQFGKYYDAADWRGVITGWHNSNVLFENCIFRNCLGLHCGILYTFSGSSFTLRSNTFYNNSTNSWSGLINLSGSNFDVINNHIFNNDCGGILRLSEANLRVIGNSIYHNNGAIHLHGSNFEVTNNTFYNNDGGTSFGEGDYLRVRNSIMGPEYVSFSGTGYTVRNSYIPMNCGGECSEMIDSPPVFVNPLGYRGTGPDEEVFAAGYSLSAISPGIDQGTADTSGLDLMQTDVAGQPRIHNGRIDIGAYENPWNIPVIANQPEGGSFCSGDAHLLRISYANSDSALFQWIKDGVILPGENNDSLQFDSLTIADEGNYFCRVRNSFGTVQSNPVFLKITSPPEILAQPLDSWRESGKQIDYQVLFNGTAPLRFQWSLNGQDIEGANLPEYRFVPSDSSYEGMYSCRISNACGTAETRPFSMYLAPQLCMVTVSDSTGSNLVIWEKKTKAPVFAYNVYRESSAAGIYDLLGTVPYDDLSVFEDTAADPTIKPYLYKITAVDTAGIETDADLCKPHKTIHLLISTNPELNSTQLEWDRYYGFDYQTYLVYRSTSGYNFEIRDSIASSINSWTDPAPAHGTSYYRISVRRPEACEPEAFGRKAGTGPYHHSLSNLDDNRLQTGHNPPDSLWIDNLNVTENQLPGTLVGRLHTSDPDSGDVFIYQLVAGEGDDDNNNFTILSDLLLTAKSLDCAIQDTHSVRIRTKDVAGNSMEASFSIHVLQDVTGILPDKDPEALRVYPNPTSGMTTIEMPGNTAKAFRLRLFDLYGKVLLDEDGIREPGFELDCRNIAPGIYFLELRGADLYRAKLVIER